MKKYFFLLLSILLFSCSSTENEDGVYTKSTSVENNLMKSIPSPWKEVEDGGPDFALSNGKTKSFFLFNSACRRNQVGSLNNLTNSILTGLNDVEILDKTVTDHQGNRAVSLTAKGNLEGVTRFMKILTMIKDNCIYDFALISTTPLYLEQDTPHFYQFIQLLKIN